MAGADNAITFAKLLDHIARQVIRADVEMQLLQRQAWFDLNKGYPTLEGLDHFAYLGLTEVKFTLWLEEVKPAIWIRIKDWFRTLFGKPSLIVERNYRIGSAQPASKAAFGLTVVITRDSSGRVTARSEPPITNLEGNYVTTFFT